ncbi:hypothetical protein LOTGIDRAFT_158797 [Lottia gigantea]|uniref:Glycoside hydrolase family 42 N-terminal domain-containing protein n=1 Tax=Lottia gigantea TaxID=225164 RepID=V4ANV5_LOTGI|nr:hypothetical protein LOTGIDRAFT_158797 [Lottia gigantea]ESO98847.1 hypothetical protein LOTGIDRAFT_158797 [Lottia gigantea]
MKIHILAVLFSFFSATNAATLRFVSQTPLSITINKDGSYTVNVNGEPWLESSAIYFYAEGRRVSMGDGSLKIASTFMDNGYDSVGQYGKTCWRFEIESKYIDTCFKQYMEPTPFIIFEQHYLNDTENTASIDYDYTIAGFPAFTAPPTGKLGYLHYAGSMTGDSDKSFGIWQEKAKMLTGVAGGPLVLFDKDADDCLILSPLNQFMAASSLFDGQNYSTGVLGGVNFVPKDFVLQTVLFYGKGINHAMSDWGLLLTQYYGKDDSYRKSDLTLNYIGYWTDGGAYYYYNTEPNKTYQQTILDVRQNAKDIGMPYKFVQYDSFFYYKGPHGGVKTWVPMPDLFPDGFQYLYNQTGWPAGAHNRWWSPKTTYARQNGGNFDFIVEEAKAVPTDQAFWDYLFDSSKKWGLTLYEQDWLDNEFAGVKALLTQIDLGRTWLMQMGRAAQENGITIQYCMSNPRHIMQSVEIPVVTQARASGDYRAGKDNWKIGISSIMVDALGVAPFKDNFWSSPDQPGNPAYPDLKETHADLQVAVSTLSTAPVAPGDMLNKTNVPLVMQCCNADGMLLQPSKPAKAIDAQILQLAFGGDVGPQGDIWTTFSNIAGFYFGIILGTDMTADYNLTPSKASFKAFLPSEVFPRFASIPKSQEFSASNPLVITTNCTKTNICLYYTSPVFSPGGTNVLIYGEENKIVPMSPKRVTDITLDRDLKLTLTGAAKESVRFGFILPDQYITITCQLGQSGSAVLSFNERSCNGY